MKCIFCNSEMETKPTDVETGWGDYKVIMKGVKAYVCLQCGHKVFDQDDVRMMHRVSAALSESPEKPTVLNVEEVADLLRVSTQTVYNMIKDGRIPAKKIGREWRFSRYQIERLLHDNETGSTQAVALAARAKEDGNLSENDRRIIEKYTKMLQEQQEGAQQE
ncbi:MAG: hypothetical protein PWQ13_280 [Bacillota bacterium]|nr:hypothetical protein [Bacillota bacterium]